MNNTLFSSDINPNTNLDSPQLETKLKLSYFEQITQKLDSWQAKQQAIREAKAQVTKSFLLQDPDDVNGVVKTYRLTVELIATEQVDAHQLELMEVMDYAN